MSVIYGNPSGGFGYPKTFILTDDGGNELTGVVTGQEQIFTATDDKVYSGFTYVGDNGISTGTREFISYRTTQSVILILPGKDFSISLSPYDKYNYTKFQCMIAKYNSNVNDSVAISKVSLNDCVFNVNSTNKLSDVTKNSNSKSIDLNITNDTEDIYIIHFITYKEEEI